MTNLKVTAVGDGVVGKTCLLISYTKGEFPFEYVPTVFEHYPTTIEFNGESYNVTLWDTAGQEDYERLRPLSYPGTNCFLVCFAVNKNLASYDNVYLKWVPEVKHHVPTASIILVATKIDLRDDPTVLCYTEEDGKKLKKKVKAAAYMECSAKTRVGIEEVFLKTVEICSKANNNSSRTNRCRLL